MSKVKPTKQQLDFLDMELGVFLHFGIRTFNEEHRDWDMKPMSPETFNPTELDCEKWADDILSAGAKYAVMTTKHHDGFALWPSALTDFSVKSSPWKDGKGDVVKEYTDAMRKKGLKVGLYYSCSQFDAKEQSDNYCDFVIAQITELLTNYGKIDILWFDSCGSDGDNFDVAKIARTIYDLQPDVMVFGAWGRDIRWIGNEWGLAPMINDNTVSNIAVDINNPEKKLEEDFFMPGECDCCVVRNRTENFWFYTETYKDCVRTKDEMLGLYYYSIGRGSNLLINLAPDRRGLLQESNVELLRYMSNEMKRRLVDGKIEYRNFEKKGNEYQITFDRAYVIDHVVLEEDMTEGQNIKEFTVYSSPYRGNNRIAVYRGCTVGHKQVCCFPPIRSGMVDVVIEKADEGEKLSNITVAYSKEEQIIQK